MVIKEIKEMKERILSLTLRDLLDEEIRKELLKLELALQDILILTKTPKGFDYNTWKQISGLKQNKIKNLKKFGKKK